MRLIKKILWFFFYSFHSWFVFLWYFDRMFIVMADFIYGYINFYVVLFQAYIIRMARSRLTVRSVVCLSLSFLLVFSCVLLFWYWSVVIVWVLKSSDLLCVWRNVRRFFIRFRYNEIWNIMVCGLGLFRFYFWLVLKLVFE